MKSLKNLFPAVLILASASVVPAFAQAARSSSPMAHTHDLLSHNRTPTVHSHGLHPHR